VIAESYRRIPKAAVSSWCLVSNRSP